MPLSEDTIRSIVSRGLDAGYSVDEIKARIQSFDSAEPPQESGTARLKSQFEGTLAAPTEDFPSVERESGLGSALGGLNELVPATLGNVVVGPLAGVGETVGIVDEGTRAGLRENFEEKRVDYLSKDPSALRATIAGVTEGLSEAVPLAPGGKLGKMAASKVGGPLAKRLVAGSVAGASEGLVVGIGDTVGMSPEERLKRGALVTAAAGAFGAAGGLRSMRRGVGESEDEVVKGFARKYFRNNPPGKSGEGMAEKVARQWFDDYASVSRLTKRVAPERANDVENLLQMGRTAEHTSVAPIYEHTRAFDAENSVTGESFRDIMFDLDDEVLGDLRAYSAAKRNIDRSTAVDAKGKPKVAVSKESLKDSAKVVDHISDKYGVDADGRVAILDEKLSRFRDWSTRAILQPLRDVGVLSDEAMERMLAEGDWWVPFYRAADEVGRLEGAGFIEPGMKIGSAPVKGKYLHRGLESEAGLRIEDPFQSAAEMAIRVHSFARKQQIRNMLGDFADEFADELGDEVVKAEGHIPGKTFRVFRDGDMVGYHANKGLLDAVETLNFRQANWVLRSARNMTRLFRAGATITPEFGIRNIMRDQFTFGVYSKYGGIPFISPAKAMIEEALHRVGKGTSSDDWKAFMASPGAHATFLSGDKFNMAREIEVFRRRGGKQSGMARRIVEEHKKNPLYGLQSLSQMLERPSRFAEFKLGKGRGESDLAAGYGASDVTLNFPRAGSIGKRLNLYEAFFNAMMQDISKFGRAMGEKPFATSAKALAYITAPSMAIWAKHKDDPEYQSLPEWEKALFIHLWKKDNGKFFRMPMPPGILGVLFSYLPRKAAEHFINDDPDALREFAEEFVQQTPLQYVPVNTSVSSAEDAVIRMAPNALQPALEVFANRVPFFDAPVVSERLKRLPPAERKKVYTSNIAKVIAGAANSAGMPTAPVAIDHLIGGYGAGVGRWVQDLSGRESGVKSMESDGIFAAPGLRGLMSVSPYGFGSQPVRDLYEFAHSVEESSNGLKLQSNKQRYENYLSLHPEALYAKDVRKARADLKEYAEARAAVRDDTTLAPEEKEDILMKIDQEVTMYSGKMMESFQQAIEMDKHLSARER
jgi:hypothetical protein